MNLSGTAIFNKNNNDSIAIRIIDNGYSYTYAVNLTRDFYCEKEIVYEKMFYRIFDVISFLQSEKKDCEKEIEWLKSVEKIIKLNNGIKIIKNK